MQKKLIAAKKTHKQIAHCNKN